MIAIEPTDDKEIKVFIWLFKVFLVGESLIGDKIFFYFLTLLLGSVIQWVVLVVLVSMLFLLLSILTNGLFPWLTNELGLCQA